MFRFLFLSDALRHPAEFPPRAVDLAPRLFLLWAIHFRQGFGEPPAGTTQDGNRHLQIALEFARGLFLGQRLPLRFQKQLRLGQDALANQTRAFAPGGVELPGWPRVAAVLDESGGHPLAILQVDSRHRHQILHRQFSAKRRDTQLALRSKRRANSSRE